MVNPSEKLHEIFGEFKARLHKIQTAVDFQPDPTGSLFLEDAISQTHGLSPEVVLPFIGYLITDVEDLISKGTKFKRKVTQRFSTASPINPFLVSPPEHKLNIDSAVKIYCKEVKAELKMYLSKLNTLNQKLYDDHAAIGESTPTEKVMFNLPIVNIAVLFRLMKDLDIIPKTIELLDLATKMSDALYSKNKKGAPRTLKKLLSEYDDTALEYWIKKFEELIKHTKNVIQEKELRRDEKIKKSRSRNADR